MVSCSPCSLYVNFLSVSDQVFWLSMPFDNHVKKGEKFDIDFDFDFDIEFFIFYFFFCVMYLLVL